MVNTTDARAPQIGVASAARTSLTGTDPSRGGARNFVVVFRRNETRLEQSEVAELGRWIRSWLSDDASTCLLLGCCADSARQGRLRRLHGLCEQLVACGVPRRSICFTDDWAAMAWAIEPQPLPQDFVWMNVIDGTRADRSGPSIRRLLDGH
jgi:hypothetical protein